MKFIYQYQYQTKVRMSVRSTNYCYSKNFLFEVWPSMNRGEGYNLS